MHIDPVTLLLMLVVCQAISCLFATLYLVFLFSRYSDQTGKGTRFFKAMGIIWAGFTVSFLVVIGVSEILYIWQNSQCHFGYALAKPTEFCFGIFDNPIASLSTETSITAYLVIAAIVYYLLINWSSQAKRR